MDDARGWRHDRKIVEGLLAPLQELVTLAIALELPLGIELQGSRRSESVDLDRMVYDEVGRNEWVDLPWISAHILHRATHRREVDDRRHTGEVLHDNPGRQVRKLSADRLGPVGQRLDVLFRDEYSTSVAQERLEHHPDGERQREHIPVRPLVQRLQAEDLYLFRAGV